MKKFTLFLIAMLAVSTLSMAQSKLYVYQADGSRTEFLAADVDSISISENTSDFDSDVNANGHEYVDLGLPSGTLWATCNVGANTPEEAGDKYAWGETSGSYYTTWNAYKWSLDSEGGCFKKYSTKTWGVNCEADGRVLLDLIDDVANVVNGGNWRMPTKSEMEELIKYCTWDDCTSVQCIGVSKINGNKIILPSGLYWSSSLRNEDNREAYVLSANNSRKPNINGMARYWTYNIRPVLSKSFICKVNIDGNGGVGANSSSLAYYADFVSAPENLFTRDGYEFICWNTKPDGSGINYAIGDKICVSSDLTLYALWYNKEINLLHEYVDLGLSVKWATCNVGANQPEEAGYYFAWGETKPKVKYNNENYLFQEDGGILTKYIASDFGDWLISDNITELEVVDDAASINWAQNWRMPTKVELEELRSLCTWSWTIRNNVYGYLITSKINGNSIFMPAVECHDDDNSGDSVINCIWGASLNKSSSYEAYIMKFDSDNVTLGVNKRYIGCPVRPVLP